MSAPAKTREMKKKLMKNILLYEIAGYLIVIAAIWMDELFDLPRFLFKAPQTPVNWEESLFESVIVAVLAGITIYFTYRYIKHIRYLEGFLIVCSFCKKIRIGNEWIPIETFISEKSEAKFSHGLCPDCLEKHYGEYLDDMDKIREKKPKT